jgi:hypothetical protein
LEGSWETGSLFFDYELQITNYGEERNLVVGRCAVQTDSVCVCVCVSDSFLTAENTEVAESFDLGNVF